MVSEIRKWKVQKNSVILRYVTWSKTSSGKARNLICQAFIQPYLQLTHSYLVRCNQWWSAVTPKPPDSRIERRTLSPTSHRNFSQIKFWVKLCPCICECTSMNQRSVMLYLDEDSINASVIGWIIPWKIDENANWTVSWRCSVNNTENPLKHERERDWKSELVV